MVARDGRDGGVVMTVEEQMNSHILTSARPNGLTELEGIGSETCPDAGV